MNTEVIKEEAELYRLLLITGFAKCEEVVAWADKIIETTENPPDQVIEISITTKINDIISMLGQIKGDYDFNAIFKKFLGTLFERLSLDSAVAAKLAHKLYVFMFECEHELPPEIEKMIYYFDDGFDLAVQGVYGNVNDLTSEFKAFLCKYRKG